MSLPVENIPRENRSRNYRRNPVPSARREWVPRGCPVYNAAVTSNSGNAAAAPNPGNAAAAPNPGNAAAAPNPGNAAAAPNPRNAAAARNPRNAAIAPSPRNAAIAPSRVNTAVVQAAGVRPVVTVENMIGNGYGVQSNSRPLPPPERTYTYPGTHSEARGIMGHHRDHWRGEKEREREREKERRLKDANLPLLVQEIQDKLHKGTVECMICYDMVNRAAPIWSCSSCYSIFHLSCIKKWARAPTSVDLSSEKSLGGFNWRCPGCQAVQLTPSNQIRYVCFCGSRRDPSSDLYLTPHSCGESCGKPLEKEAPDSDMAKEDLCPHMCVLQCHPGPCPPCKAFAPPRNCPCGKKVITTRCSDRKDVLTCGQQCDKLLDCGRHRCQRKCHVGTCDPCEVIFNASCFCKKKAEEMLCGSLGLKGEIKGEEGVFSCESVCEKKLGCGNHDCYDICHPGPCGECELLPSKVNSCSCGKTKLSEDRKSCLDPISTCSLTCSKTLPCGIHSCEKTCHNGPCSPCSILVSQKCRCRSTSRTVECYKTLVVEESEMFHCDRQCGHKKNCGRHRCSERCCPLSNSKNPIPSSWDPHFCSMPCGKKLRCGQHSCPLLCHSGHCPPCLQTIFTDLTCACARTSIPPPLPCGTPPPSCQHPCSVPQPCGHPSTHSCHFGDCPPCTVPIAKECIGGHVVLRNIPCGSKDIRCNKLCGKTRQCGLHACGRTCHPSPCDALAEASAAGKRASCGQACGAPRRDCRHTCTALCHPSGYCPDVRCEFPVTISCSCGRITATVPCDAGGNNAGYSGDVYLGASVVQKLPAPLQPIEGNVKVPLGQRKLMCDDDCAKTERKKLLADAFGVVTPNLEGLHLSDNEVLNDILRREPKWAIAVEERCRYLVLGRGRGGISSVKVHVFCPMTKEKRDVLRAIADRWKLTVSAAGWEPKRFVILHATQKSKAPSRLLGLKNTVANSMLQPSVFDPLVDMDPRLVVALFDLPRDADISALVLRFGGECELVWLNDKNALAVFNDPTRAATAMRRLDQGSLYHGAAVVSHSVGSSAAPTASGVWGASSTMSPKDGGGKDNPWKKAVMHERHGRETSWGAEEWSDDPIPHKGVGAPVSAANRWSVLDAERSSSRIAATSEDAGNKLRTAAVASSSSVLAGKQLQGAGDEDVADDWEKAFE